EIKIAGTPVASGSIAPGQKVTPTFNTMGGPVEVTASDRVIASQRIVWGPSFEEVPGYPNEAMASAYHWTWYDQAEGPGVTNWVLIANPGTTAVNATVKIAGTPRWSGAIPAGGRVTPTFPGVMGGPVEVSATGQVMSSQRVIWNGYFNEVLGTVLN
ncbi:MAG TPA: hypothetical protein VE173_06220, partial [Longimicrobiales bacterium]|nr:hypothetical protein [Longimicrobiales bacterium]